MLLEGLLQKPLHHYLLERLQSGGGIATGLQGSLSQSPHQGNIRPGVCVGGWGSSLVFHAFGGDFRHGWCWSFSMGKTEIMRMSFESLN